MSRLIKMYDGCDYAGMLECAAESSREWPIFLRTAIARNVGADATIQWAKGLGPTGPEVDELSAILTKLAHGAVARKGIAHGDGIRFIAQAVGRAFPNMVQRCSGVDTSATPKALKEGEKAIVATRPDGEKVKTVGFKLILRSDKADIADETETVPMVGVPLEHAEPAIEAPAHALPNPFTDHDKALEHYGRAAGHAQGIAESKAQVEQAQAQAQAQARILVKAQAQAQAQAHALVRESVLNMLGMLTMMPDSIGDHAWACESRKSAAPSRKGAAPSRKSS